MTAVRPLLAHCSRNQMNMKGLHLSQWRLALPALSEKWARKEGAEQGAHGTRRLSVPLRARRPGPAPTSSAKLPRVKRAAHTGPNCSPRQEGRAARGKMSRVGGSFVRRGAEADPLGRIARRRLHAHSDAHRFAAAPILSRAPGPEGKKKSASRLPSCCAGVTRRRRPAHGRFALLTLIVLNEML